MTDLTTTHLKFLLDKATPGPWKSKDSDCITSEHGEVLWNADQAVSWNRNDHDVNLAAAAPALAQEILWMRREIGELRNELARTATDCAILDNHEGRLAARIAQSAAETLFRILLEEGNHDE